MKIFVAEIIENRHLSGFNCACDDVAALVNRPINGALSDQEQENEIILTLIEDVIDVVEDHRGHVTLIFKDARLAERGIERDFWNAFFHAVRGGGENIDHFDDEKCQISLKYGGTIELRFDDLPELITDALDWKMQMRGEHKECFQSVYETDETLADVGNIIMQVHVDRLARIGSL